jgi:hypothetical protein
MPVKHFACSAMGLLLATSVVLADTGACSACHEDTEFEGMSADDIAAAARDTSIPPHKKIVDLSDEQLEIVAAELAGG